MPELLIKLQSQVDLEKITKFNINRNLVLDGARRAIKRKSFCAKSKISVKFTDDVGIAEGAVDEGGPKREFLRMLMKKIQYLHIFEGPENRRILAYSTSGEFILSHLGERLKKEFHVFSIQLHFYVSHFIGMERYFVMFNYQSSG